MDKTNKNVLIFACVAFLLLIAAYANHFNNGFHFDDYHTIVTNVSIRNLQNIPAFFSDPRLFSSDPDHWGLRSLVTITLAIDYWLGGGVYPFWFQFSTFVWHIGLCILLFFLYRSILSTAFKSYWPVYLAMAAAAFYGLHKANAETLNYIISRSDVLSTFMIVLSLYTYIAWPGKRKYYFYIIPAFIGVFAKETVPVLVIIMFFYMLLFERGLSIGDLFRAKNFKIILKVFVQMLPLIIVVVATQLYTLSRIKSIPGISNPLLPYVLTQSFVWVRYFILFFIPVNVTADSDWTILPNFYDERILIGCLFVLTLIVIIFRTSRNAETRPISFGLIWFAAALLPTSLAPFAEVTNDHRMYFPFIGLALSVFTYLGLLIKRYRIVIMHKRNFSYLIGLFLVVLSLNAYGIFQRNKVWKDDKSLWYDVTVKSPTNGRGLMNYGLAEMADNNYIVAEMYFKRAKQFIPYYNALYINMGILDGDMHRDSDAIANFNEAITLAPNEYISYMFYARYLVQSGKINEARTMAEKAVSINPYSETALYLLMRIYNLQEQWDLLKNAAERTIAILPGNKDALAYLNAAKIKVPINLYNDKMPADSKAAAAAALLDESLKYYNAGEYQKCIDACNQAIALKPDYADAYSNMGAAYNKLKQWDKCIAACKKALAIDPAHALAKGNLNFAQGQLKK